jgi:hypothetical protein
MNVIPIEGWVLIAREEDAATGIKSKRGPFYICWHEIFSRRKTALNFAKQAGWQPGYRATRAKLAAV